MRSCNVDPRYERYQENLLLHSMVNYWHQIKRLMDVVRPRSICEIGVEGGTFSKYLLEFTRENKCRYIGVEPFPTPEIDMLIKQYKQTLVKASSLDEAAQEALKSDIIFIDGDHNYYTVYHELHKIFELGDTTVVVLHDTGWPCGRRDLYYDVSSIPKKWRHAYTFEGGLVPGKEGVQPHGFSGKGSYAVALHDGGERNGVLTAVEDFIKERPNFQLIRLTAIFGMTLLYRPKAQTSEVREFLDFFEKSLQLWNPLFANMEDNRIELLIEFWKQYDELLEKERIMRGCFALRLKNRLKRLFYGS